MSPEEQSWKDGKTPEEIAALEERGRRLMEYFRDNPDIEPSPVEGTSIRAELERRRQADPEAAPDDKLVE